MSSSRLVISPGYQVVISQLKTELIKLIIEFFCRFFSCVIVRRFFSMNIGFLQGPRNDFILGGAHCFSTFENATFLE